MAFNLKDHKSDFLFVPLGGSNEIGMNLNLYHYEGKWLMIDLGIGFADDYLPGVDVVVPDIDFIVSHKESLVGLILTHAHEDHLGAVPYLWESIGCPIYATPFTAAVLKAKLVGEGFSPGKVPIHEMLPGNPTALGPFTVEMIPLTHSIPEMQAIAVRTDKGVVMHTGDWKLDDAPMVGPVSDEVTLARYGDEGILAMVCDSTNVFVEGVSGSEEKVRENLVKMISECPYRVAVSTFASNIARIESILLAAREAGRHVVLAGRSLWRIVEAARESGYLSDGFEFLSDKEAMNLPREDVLIICTGCQGEPLAALSKMARGEHPTIRLSPGDTVIFSSRKIPGNEARISWVHNKFIDRGVEVLTERNSDIHVSGHPARAELTRMYELVRPKIAIPVHGETRHLHEHTKLARSLHVPEAVEATNGSVILLEEGDAHVIGNVHSGYIAVDGTSLIPADSPVIRTRRKLRDDGCVVVAIALTDSGELVGLPAITAPGSLDPAEDKDIFEALQEEITEALERLRPGESSKRRDEAVRGVIRRVFKNELGKRPVIEIQIIRV